MSSDIATNTNIESFEFLSQYFGEHPKGKLIHCLQNNEPDLEVMLLLLPGNGNSGYYHLGTDQNKENVFGECQLVPFNPKDFPSNIEWKFIKSNGVQLTFSKKIIYEEDV